ncbi:alkaline phosphatase [Vibrio navarrensis]|uniref:esterase-like activity of phytase family protein n=1 Tax=Vibrio navarrensis TaxID=29495 RepID=UPI00186A7514|nr:esterase-like activity of phytase family protein [Vibrio navarrensis]MBE4577258.1 alkaline phosphatase [Vibrio navarrensis]MBE4596169.1 alkaline phosphatase [Vibrio navarrensis]MBE4600544.1 alkaline phosphatase [Vibrio navarrensis]
MFISHFRLGALALILASSSFASSADSFKRIASFPVADNVPHGMDSKKPTSAEIITATEDGNTLIYSDSPLGGIGFIDIKQPHMPQAAGFLSLHGEPTSVAAYDKWVLAAVNTSENYTQPSGYLAIVSATGRKIVDKCELGGQPDSVAVSKDGRYIAVAIENERDESLNDGELPQLPAGFLVIIAAQKGKADCSTARRVTLTGLAQIAPDDPEPEFVAFNTANQIALTLQENNHIVIVDAASAKVVNHFSAGRVDLQQIDVKKDGALLFTGEQKGVLREPDAVKWLDNERLVIANEGDYHGGARGFTIFSKQGEVLFESGASFEHQIVRAGHYPEKRSGKKGAEPEGLEVATFNGQQYIFVLSERGSAVGVYQDERANPRWMQLLPSGIAPESAVAIPQRNLLATANEADLIAEGGARSHVMIYQLSSGEPTYPQIVSENDKHGAPIGWGALSGLASDGKTPGKLYAVNDSFYSSQPTIFTIDASKTPAVIKSALTVTRDGKAAKKLDLEGITTDGKGGFWLASEGNAAKEVPHALYHVNAKGEIQQTVEFPQELLQYETRFGAEGVTLVDDTLWVAVQRPWKDDPSDRVKLLAYHIPSDTWRAVHYPLEQTEKGWVGLSEITAFQGNLYLLERDNQLGKSAKIKRLYKVSLKQISPVALGQTLPVVQKELAYDFLPELKAGNGYVVDKIEGFTIDPQGRGYAVTDNDGVDDSSGETLFFKLKLDFLDR